MPHMRACWRSFAQLMHRCAQSRRNVKRKLCWVVRRGCAEYSQTNRTMSNCKDCLGFYIYARPTRHIWVARCSVFFCALQECVSDVSRLDDLIFIKDNDNSSLKPNRLKGTVRKQKEKQRDVTGTLRCGMRVTRFRTNMVPLQQRSLLSTISEDKS